MALAQAFNTASQNTTAADAAELLMLLQRKCDGSSQNLGLYERAIELIKNGASLSVTDAEHGRTPLMWASFHCRAKVLDEILPRTDNPMVTDKEGKTALDHARKRKHQPAIERLEKAEGQYRQRLLAELQDVSTKRDTKVMKTLVFKRPAPQGAGQK